MNLKIKQNNNDVGFILWSTNNFGGMERRYLRLASYFMDRSDDGAEVFVLCQTRCLQEVKRIIPEKHWSKIILFGSSFFEHKINSISILKEVFYLSAKIRKMRFKYLHFIGNPGSLSFLIGISGYFISKLSLSMVDTTYQLNTSKISIFAGNLSLFFFSKIDCLSEFTQSILIKNFYKIHKKKYLVAPCSFSDYSLVIKNDIIRDLDIVMISRIVEDKGYDLIEESMWFLKDFSFMCYGKGNLNLNISKEYISYTQDPYLVMSRSKIFLSLQKNNNYPSQSVLEAMASGCAIIATDVGETRKFLNSDNSILIPYNSAALINAIQFLISNAELRKQLGKNAKDYVLNTHTIDKYASYFKNNFLFFLSIFFIYNF